MGGAATGGGATGLVPEMGKFMPSLKPPLDPLSLPMTSPMEGSADAVSGPLTTVGIDRGIMILPV